MAFPSEEKLKELIEPLTTSHGLVVEAIKTTRAGKKSVVAIAVDCADVTKHVGSELLEVLSNEVSELFDAAEERSEVNFGPGYTLEVSTPGVDLQLTLPRHWARNRGRLVRLDEQGWRSTWRVGALSEDEARVILIGRDKKRLILRDAAVAELASTANAVVEIEFATPGDQETELVALTYDEAIRREEHDK